MTSATFDALADLQLEIDGYTLEGLRAEVSSGFERLSTVVHLRGAGHEGIGEDVVYDGVDQTALREAGPVHALAGRYALGDFCTLIDSLDLFPVEPQRDVSRLYRRWTFHSAALDLALRQAGRPLHEVLGRAPRPVTFVVSLRLGDPPTLDPITRRLERYPTLRFKLDPTSSWDPELIAALVATEAVDSSPRARPPRSPTRTTGSPGTLRSTRSPTSRRSPSRPGWSTSSLPGSARYGTSAPPTTTAPSTASAPTAVASSSSGPDAGRPSTSPPCSIPTPPTTSRRPDTTSTIPQTGYPQARSRWQLAAPDFAGPRHNWQRLAQRRE